MLCHRLYAGKALLLPAWKNHKQQNNAGYQEIA